MLNLFARKGTPCFQTSPAMFRTAPHETIGYYENKTAITIIGNAAPNAGNGTDG